MRCRSAWAIPRAWCKGAWLAFEDKRMKSILPVGQLLSLDDVMDFVRKMGEVASSDDLAFDFSGLRYVRTVPVALFARELRLLVAKRARFGLKTCSVGHDDDKSVALAYLAFIGFFDFIGLPGIGRKVRATAEVAGRHPYLAITKYSYQRFKVAAEYDPYRTEYDYISEEARRIARLLKTTDTRNSLSAYAVCEVLRNAYEHSGSADFYAMGQVWPDGCLELVVMDDGNGILKTLKGKYPKLTSERDAIREAMKPGVSGSDFTKRKGGGREDRRRRRKGLRRERISGQAVPSDLELLGGEICCA